MFFAKGFYLFPVHYKLHDFLWVIRPAAESDVSDEDSCCVKWPICVQMTSSVLIEERQTCPAAIGTSKQEE